MDSNISFRYFSAFRFWETDGPANDDSQAGYSDVRIRQLNVGILRIFLLIFCWKFALSYLPDLVIFKV